MNNNSNLAYDNIIGNNFWYEFDNIFFGGWVATLLMPINDTMQLEVLNNSYRNSGTFPDQ